MKIILLFCCILLNCHCFGQSILWEKKFDNGQVHMEINKTADSCFIVSGSSNIMGFYPAHIVKYNQNGIAIWQNLVSNLYTGDQDIIQTENSAFIFVGAKEISPPVNYSDILVRKLNAAGDTIWNNVYFTPGGDRVNKVLGIEDTTLLIFGITDSNGLGIFTLRKINESGDLIWYKEFSYSSHGYSADMIINSSQDIILFGNRSTPSSPSFHPYIIKVNQNGDTIQTKNIIAFDSTQNEICNGVFNNIIETTDGGYAFSGYIDSLSIRTGFIVKTDSAFNKQWVFLQPPPAGKNQYVSKVAQMSDGTFLLLRNQENPATWEIIITRVSATGQLLANYNLHTNWCSKVRLYDWEFLPDSSVVIVGGCLDTPLKGYMAKVAGVGVPAVVQPIDTTGHVGMPFLYQPAKVTLFPNPAQNTLNLQHLTGQNQFAILTATGTTIKTGILTETQNSLNVAALPNGLYFLRLNERQTFKFVISR